MYPLKGRGFGHVNFFSIWVQLLSFLSHMLSGEESGRQKQYEMHAGEIGEKCTPSLLSITTVRTKCTLYIQAACDRRVNHTR